MLWSKSVPSSPILPRGVIGVPLPCNFKNEILGVFRPFIQKVLELGRLIVSQTNFSTSNTNDADYSVNQQSSDMNGYNTGTDTDTSHQFHLSQTTANGLTDIPNVTYNHDRVTNLMNQGLYFVNFLSYVVGSSSVNLPICRSWNFVF